MARVDIGLLFIEVVVSFHMYGFAHMGTVTSTFHAVKDVEFVLRINGVDQVFVQSQS